MTKKDFWHNSLVAVIGGGNWGTMLAHLIAPNCREVRIWVRSEELARQMNSTRSNPRYLPEMKERLHERVHVYSDISKVIEEETSVVIWALPSRVLRGKAREFAKHFRGHELVLHAVKGVEEGTLKRMSEVLLEELPLRRVGVVSGPNLAHEIAAGEPAATVVASAYDEVVDVGVKLLSGKNFFVFGESDVIGVEWAGILKNVLAIAAGAIDQMGLGANVRAMLISRGVEEMARFGVALGAKEHTFLGLAGVGDLLATCAGPLSRNYRVGAALARGEKLTQVLRDLGSTAEGVRTAKYIHEFAEKRSIQMPIVNGVYKMLMGGQSISDMVRTLV